MPEVPEVTVRDAQRGDAAAISEVSTAAVPHLVRSAAGVAADLREDARLGRRRWVGLVEGRIAGTATARIVADQEDVREVVLTVAVHPDFGSRGLGSRLLQTAAGAFPDATALQAHGTDDPISMAFAVRHGFLPEDEHPLSLADPQDVPDVGPPPDGIRPVTLAALPDMRMLLETHNLAAADPAEGPLRRLTMYQLRSEWWDDPDNAPDLSWGLLAPGRSAPVLVSFTSVRVDRDRGRAWSGRTATHPDHRHRGLAEWVLRRTLNALAGEGVLQAWAPDARDNPALVALNRAAGYRPATRSIQLARRLPRA